MVDSMAKIIQFGDEYPDVFVFSPFEEEDDWSDISVIESITFQQKDGVYFFDDSESRKGEKILTKRFKLHSDPFYQKYQTQKQKYKRECDSKQAYLTLLKDAFYRGLRGAARGGKLKRLYVQMEDGSIRWTWAKPQEASYIRTAAEQNGKGLAMVVDFLVPEPYFYEINDGVTFYHEEFDLSHLVLVCEPLEINPNYIIKRDTKICKQTCDEHGLIIRDESLLGYLGDVDCFYPGCSLDPCQSYLGTAYPLELSEGQQEVEICVDGSAGATSPYISFRNNWENPSVTNLANNQTIEYNGVIEEGEYLEIDLGSSDTGDIADYTINTNIDGFDANDITISNFGIFELTIGINTFRIEGITGDAIFTVNFLNKYHN